MKKIACLFLLLCLMLQCIAFPAAAAETTEATESAQNSAQTAFGSTPITSGCRTINGMSPLGGSEKMLETAQSAFVFEANTETVIYGYNPDLRLYPGSLIKILTALVALERGNLDDELTVTMREIPNLPAGALVADLKNGEIITLRDALYLLILESANDAALVIAEYIAGSENSFVMLMNERLKQLGCNNTNVTTCTGMSDPLQYTTARDLAKIMMAAREHEFFVEAFGAKTYEIAPTNKNEETRKVESGNHLRYELVLPQYNDVRVTGGIPSYISDAGASIAFTAEDDGMLLICVLMGCTRTNYPNSWRVQYYGNFDEALDILDFAFSGYHIKELLYEGQALNQFSVANGECAVVGQPDEGVTTVMPKGVNMKHLTFRYSAAGGGMYAPIESGQMIATVQVWYVNSCITEAKLYAMNPVSPIDDTGVKIRGAGRDDSNMSGILGFLGTIFLVVLVPVAAYLIYNNVRRYLAHNKRRRRRASRRRSR